MTAFVDTNVLIRHLTADSPEMAERATAFLAKADELLLPDLMVAEDVYVLESYHEVERDRVAELVRSILAFGPIRTLDPALLLGALEAYVDLRLDVADACLVASAEIAGVPAIVSFDGWTLVDELEGHDEVSGIVGVRPPTLTSPTPPRVGDVEPSAHCDLLADASAAGGGPSPWSSSTILVASSRCG